MTSIPRDFQACPVTTCRPFRGLAIVFAAFLCSLQAHAGIVIDQTVVEPIGDPTYRFHFFLSLEPGSVLTTGDYLTIYDVAGIFRSGIEVLDSAGNVMQTFDSGGSYTPISRIPYSSAPSHFLFFDRPTGFTSALTLLPTGFSDDALIGNAVFQYVGTSPISNAFGSTSYLLGEFTVETLVDYHPPSGETPPEILAPRQYSDQTTSPISLAGGVGPSKVDHYGTITPQLSVSTPEPTTWLGAMFGIGILGVLRRRRTVHQSS